MLTLADLKANFGISGFPHFKSQAKVCSKAVSSYHKLSEVSELLQKHTQSLAFYAKNNQLIEIDVLFRLTWVLNTM